MVVYWCVPVWAGRLGRGPNLRFELSWLCGTMLSTRHLDPFPPPSHLFPERERKAEKEKEGPLAKRTEFMYLFSKRPGGCFCFTRAPISSLHSCFRTARAYIISLSEGRGPEGVRER